MPYVNVPNDSSEIKTKMAFDLIKRQLVCSGGTAVIGIPSYLPTREPLGSIGTMFLMLTVMLPTFLLAMYERGGLPLEKVVHSIIQAKLLRPGVRRYQTRNIYAPFTERGTVRKEDTIAEGKEQKQSRKR